MLNTAKPTTRTIIHKFFFILLIIATMVGTPSYASYYKFALSYEKARQ